MVLAATVEIMAKTLKQTPSFWLEKTRKRLLQPKEYKEYYFFFLFSYSIALKVGTSYETTVGKVHSQLKLRHP